MLTDFDSTDLPQGSRSWEPELPAGVALLDGEIHDLVSGARVHLSEEAGRLLGHVGRGEAMEELAARHSGAWPFLLRMNAAHLVNFRRPFRAAGTPRVGCRAACRTSHRFALDRGGALAVLIVVLRAMGHRACRAPGVGPVSLVAALGCVLAAAAGLWPLPVLACSLVLGTLLHEFGHAITAVALGSPAYVIAQERGVSVWARMSDARAVRLFIAMGPLLPTAVGGLVLALAWSRGQAFALLSGLPLVVHVLGLAPVGHDGRILWFGRPAEDGSSTPLEA